MHAAPFHGVVEPCYRYTLSSQRLLVLVDSDNPCIVAECKNMYRSGFMQRCRANNWREGDFTMLKRVHIRSIVITAFVAALVPATSGADGRSEPSSLGVVDFQPACEGDAPDRFDHALTLLHHMMYEQARHAFEALAEEHPDCAMAHWGIATTLFQPLWTTQPDEAAIRHGRSAIETARELEPADEREAALIAATGAFFDPREAGYTERIQAWANAMEAALQAPPRDKDVMAFYALSRLALAQTADNPHPYHDKADALLRDVYARESRHPGAIHYIIHSSDVDGRAEKHLDIVERYSAIAPDVPHALHMPSHIYVRLGRWDDVITWNERSAKAALEQPVGDRVSMHYLHAQDYLVYAWLQQGQHDNARRVINATMQQGDFQPSPVSAFHMATIPARHAVERRDWTQAAKLAPRTPDYLPWDTLLGRWAEAQTWLGRGLGAVHGGDTESGERALERINALHEALSGSDGDRIADYVDIERHILAGWLAWRNGQPDAAVDHMQEAVAIEDRVEKHPVTPGALIPPNEALGDLLLRLDEPERALKAYAASDAVWPRRYNTLAGAVRAAEAAGNDEKLQEWQERFERLAADQKHDRQQLGAE